MQCGNIIELKLASDGDEQYATAVIEFETKEDVLTAQTKDMKLYEGNTVEVQVGSGTTLFVTNFPPAAEESYISNLFGKVS